MSDTTLWAIALSVGVLGLLLVLVAGIAAISATARARRSRERPASPDPQPRVTGPSEVHSSGGSWVWLKAGVFAFIHAGAVSFVLGGLTFFEDIARANEEIRTTGTVTFPKRLLPKTLVGPDASLPLVPARDGVLTSGGHRASSESSPSTNPTRQASANPGSDDWEVVDVVPEEPAG
jgi:hypothetical protein